MNWINSYLVRIPEDKCRHAAVMAWVAVVALLAARSGGLDGFWPVAVSWSVVTVAGLWKEYGIDARAELWDMAANYVGALAVWLAYIVG